MGSNVNFYDGQKAMFLEQMELSTHCIYPTLADLGRCEFDVVVTNNSKAVERVLRPGNPIFVEKPEYPNLNWWGILGDDMPWKGDGKVGIVAYTPHYLFTWRDAVVMGLTGDNKVFKGSPGEIIKRALKLANDEEDLFVREGDIDTTGDDVEEPFESDFYTHMKNVADNNGYSWQFRPFFGADKTLYFYLDFKKTIGKDHTNIELIEEQNFEKSAGAYILQQTGPIINKFAGISSASTSDEQFVDIQEDRASQAKYRLRQSSEQFQNIESKDAVIAAAKQKINKYKGLQNIPVLTVQNINGLLSLMDRGDVFSVRYKEAGYNAGHDTGISFPAQIMVMDHNDATPDKLALTMVEYVQPIN